MARPLLILCCVATGAAGFFLSPQGRPPAPVECPPGVECGDRVHVSRILRSVRPCWALHPQRRVVLRLFCSYLGLQDGPVPAKNATVVNGIGNITSYAGELHAVCSGDHGVSGLCAGFVTVNETSDNNLCALRAARSRLRTDF